MLAFFIGIVMPYLTSDEVGDALRAARPGASGERSHRAVVLPGMLILVGPIIWFVKTNGALNDYWASLGATR